MCSTGCYCNMDDKIRLCRLCDGRGSRQSISEKCPCSPNRAPETCVQCGRRITCSLCGAKLSLNCDDVDASLTCCGTVTHCTLCRKAITCGTFIPKDLCSGCAREVTCPESRCRTRCFRNTSELHHTNNIRNVEGTCRICVKCLSSKFDDVGHTSSNARCPCRHYDMGYDCNRELRSQRCNSRANSRLHGTDQVNATSEARYPNRLNSTGSYSKTCRPDLNNNFYNPGLSGKRCNRQANDTRFNTKPNGTRFTNNGFRAGHTDKHNEGGRNSKPYETGLTRKFCTANFIPRSHYTGYTNQSCDSGIAAKDNSTGSSRKCLALEPVHNAPGRGLSVKFYDSGNTSKPSDTRPHEAGLSRTSLETGSISRPCDTGLSRKLSGNEHTSRSLDLRTNENTSASRKSLDTNKSLNTGPIYSLLDRNPSIKPSDSKSTNRSFDTGAISSLNDTSVSRKSFDTGHFSKSPETGLSTKSPETGPNSSLYNTRYAGTSYISNLCDTATTNTSHNTGHSSNRHEKGLPGKSDKKGPTNKLNGSGCTSRLHKTDLRCNHHDVGCTGMQNVGLGSRLPDRGSICTPSGQEQSSRLSDSIANSNTKYKDLPCRANDKKSSAVVTVQDASTNLVTVVRMN